MIVGVGTDLVSMDRVRGIMERQGQRFAERILTARELETFARRKQAASYLATRFAVKEAVAKALGTGIGKISFKDMETVHDDNGAPHVILYGPARVLQEQKNIQNIFVSLSDEDHYALAFAVLST